MGSISCHNNQSSYLTGIKTQFMLTLQIFFFCSNYIVGTYNQNCLGEAVLTCTQNQVLDKNSFKHINIFQMQFSSFCNHNDTHSLTSSVSVKGCEARVPVEYLSSVAPASHRPQSGPQNHSSYLA